MGVHTPWSIPCAKKILQPGCLSRTPHGPLPLDVEPPSSNCPLEVYVASICVHVNPQQVHFCMVALVTTQLSMGTDLLG